MPQEVSEASQPAGSTKSGDRTPGKKLRDIASRHLFLLETLLYITIGVMLAIAAGVAVAQAGSIMWQGAVKGEMTNYALMVLDQLLLVLMLVEVLHTIRISIRSKEVMLVQPFLIVGLIASIRRVLVITMEAAGWADEGKSGEQAATIVFRNAMMELALLGFLILVFVVSLYLLHRMPRREDLSG